MRRHEKFDVGSHDKLDVRSYEKLNVRSFVSLYGMNYKISQGLQRLHPKLHELSLFSLTTMSRNVETKGKPLGHRPILPLGLPLRNESIFIVFSNNIATRGLSQNRLILIEVYVTSR